MSTWLCHHHTSEGFDWVTDRASNAKIIQIYLPKKRVAPFLFLSSISSGSYYCYIPKAYEAISEGLRQLSEELRRTGEVLRFISEGLRQSYELTGEERKHNKLTYGKDNQSGR